MKTEEAKYVKRKANEQKKCGCVCVNNNKTDPTTTMKEKPTFGKGIYNWCYFQCMCAMLMLVFCSKPPCRGINYLHNHHIICFVI